MLFAPLLILVSKAEPKVTLAGLKGRCFLKLKSALLKVSYIEKWPKFAYLESKVPHLKFRVMRDQVYFSNNRKKQTSKVDMAKFIKTIRNNWKKSVFFTGVNVYAVNCGRNMYEYVIYMSIYQGIALVNVRSTAYDER